MRIRTATSLDREHIRAVHLRAFPEDERDSVAKLAVDLLAERTTPRTFSLIAETGGALLGHAAFSPVFMKNTEHLQGYIVAPVGVLPDFQKRGIGSDLIESGRQLLLKMGVHILFVYGDPGYYNRFGFSADNARHYTPPYKLLYPFGWLALVINEHDRARSDVELSCVASLSDRKLW